MSEPAPESVPVSDPPPHTAGPAPLPASGRILLFAIAGGVLAGALAWLGGEAIRDLFKPAHITPSSPFSNENDLAKLKALSKEAKVAFAILGGSMGLVLGVAGGLARRSPRMALMAAVAGVLLGTVASLGAGTVGMRVADNNQARMNDDLTFSILVLAGLWVPAGLAAGLAFGLGVGGGATGPIVRGAIGGLIGAALGTVIYLIAGGLTLPTSGTGSPLPLSLGARAIARFAVAILAGAVAGSMVGGASSRKRPTVA